MTAAVSPPPAPRVNQPAHPLHALTTFELKDYRRELEHAIAFFGKQDPSPRRAPTCKPPSKTCWPSRQAGRG